MQGAAHTTTTSATTQLRTCCNSDGNVVNCVKQLDFIVRFITVLFRLVICEYEYSCDRISQAVY